MRSDISNNFATKLLRAIVLGMETEGTNGKLSHVFVIIFFITGNRTDSKITRSEVR
jgi:hypothetical protein